MTEIVDLLDRITAVLLTAAVAMFALWALFSGPGLAGSPWLVVAVAPGLTLATALVAGLSSGSLR